MTLYERWYTNYNDLGVVGCICSVSSPIQWPYQTGTWLLNFVACLYAGQNTKLIGVGILSPSIFESSHMSNFGKERFSYVYFLKMMNLIHSVINLSHSYLRVTDHVYKFLCLLPEDDEPYGDASSSPDSTASSSSDLGQVNKLRSILAHYVFCEFWIISSSFPSFRVSQHPTHLFLYLYINLWTPVLFKKLVPTHIWQQTLLEELQVLEITDIWNMV